MRSFSCAGVGGPGENGSTRVCTRRCGVSRVALLAFSFAFACALRQGGAAYRPFLVRLRFAMAGRIALAGICVWYGDAMEMGGSEHFQLR